MQNISLFIIGISLFLLLMYCYTEKTIFLWSGIICLAIPVVSFKLASLIFPPLIMVFEYIGSINSKLILAIFFLLFLTPVAWLKKLISFKEKNNTHNSESTFVENNHEYSKEDFLNQW